MSTRGFLHFEDLSDQQKDKVLNAQVKIEKAIEKALPSDGYSRDELSQRNKRDEIRGFLVYCNGKLLSMKTYDSYVKEVELGTHRSQPYKATCRNLPFGGRATRDSRDACSTKGIRAESPPTFILRKTSEKPEKTRSTNF
ncbi:hypothetical protein D0Y65_011764 [Glycine soja]|uniref:Uncharacterized protein n=1 Tax=Glycine soja TaxID=3848 RepID=A0A445KLE9_GLYSO|nr:hypothetical protein D0Y65_011764 [Glycine soja]